MTGQQYSDAAMLYARRAAECRASQKRCWRQGLRAISWDYRRQADRYEVQIIECAECIERKAQAGEQ